jgi:hypothetical protein
VLAEHVAHLAGDHVTDSYRHAIAGTELHCEVGALNVGVGCGVTVGIECGDDSSDQGIPWRVEGAGHLGDPGGAVVGVDDGGGQPGADVATGPDDGRGQRAGFIPIMV